MERDVTEHTEGLTMTWFENKMARIGYVLDGSRRIANRANW